MNYPGSLHNHTQMSNFRLRDCIIKEQDLVNRAIELGHSVLAITDHETIASAVRVEKIYKKIKENNIPLKIIMGNEIYLCRDGLNGQNFIQGEDKYYHFILLARDQVGFQQICELSTRAWMRSYMGRGLRRVPTYYQDIVDIIGKNPGHVIGSTACLGGMLATQLLKYRDNPNDELWSKIINWCKLMCSTFGGKEYFFLELQPSASKEQTFVNRMLIKISQELDINYIITTDSHYLTKEDRPVHKAFLNAQNGDREVDAFYATTYLMDTNDLIEHLDLNEFEIETAFNNIIKIQNSCEDYSILKPLNIPSLKWNDYSHIEVTKEWIEKIPYFNTFLKSEYKGDKLLVKAIIDGINKHQDLQNKEAYQEINNNLETTWISSNVNKAHWSAYYLNLQKIIDLCWEADSLVGPGRGSGVGFILLYCLGITQINPLREETKCFAWRFLNPERVSVLDVDFDIEGRRRPQVLAKFREFYGEDRVSNVTTFRTEKSKSAILTAARGLNIDNDIAQYLASLIIADRGQLRSLKETFYGDEEKDFKPNATFVYEMTNNYPELWNVAQKIEGIICGTGIHAGGVIFVDEPFTNSTALMRAPDGTICTQFDLHDAEDVSLIKYDALSVEAMDKLHICLDLLCKHGKVKREETLKATYEKVLGIYNIERNDPHMWDMIQRHEILSLFQMEQQSGIRGIEVAKPKSVNDLSVLNSVIRLMAPDKNSETPLETWSKYRQDISIWLREMKRYGLNQDEIDWLANHSAITDGICESQEGLMSLVQEPKLGGNSLTFADKCRKGIAKKQGKLFQECEDVFFENIKKNNCSEKLAHYVWDVLLRVQRGYSFNRSHCLAYSLVALQEMNLAFKFPIIYWNCACLISDSGSFEDEEEIVNIYEKEDEDYEYIDLPNREGKKKVKSVDYEKIATAIGTMTSRGIEVSLVNINSSEASFEPDEENNRILYGLKALSNINDEIINKIKEGRPYEGIKDFMNRVPIKKLAMISLIKAGAFDEVDKYFNNRKEIMAYYILQVSDMKKRLTLQNFNGLINHNLVPKELELQIRVFNFNKYLKSFKFEDYYILNETSMGFIDKHLKEITDELDLSFNQPKIKQLVWDKYYKSYMDVARNWIKDNYDELLCKFNDMLFMETWEKYAGGTQSSWEINSLCFYHGEHELEHINNIKYNIKDFNSLKSCDVDYYFKKAGKQIPIYKLNRIAGAVISKNDNRHTVTLLTTTGVVNVKFTSEYYGMFKKQVSQVQSDGSKKIIERSWFKRGTLLLITGFRRENEFVGKTYASTVGHQLYKITNVIGEDIILQHERVAPSGAIEEDEWEE